MRRTPIRSKAKEISVGVDDMAAAGIGHNGGPKLKAHGKSRLRKNAGQQSQTDIAYDIVMKIRHQYGADLQWVTDSVLGEPKPATRQEFEINAWEPVTQDMFDHLLDGMWMRKGAPGEITYAGLVLMYRPYELTMEAKQELLDGRNDALKAQERMIRGGQAISGLSDGFEPDHRTVQNVFRRSHEPMEIPQE